MQGYKCFGHNRNQLNKKAKRGSGGVGVLVLKQAAAEKMDPELCDSETVGPVWNYEWKE